MCSARSFNVDVAERAARKLLQKRVAECLSLFQGAPKNQELQAPECQQDDDENDEELPQLKKPAPRSKGETTVYV